MSKLTAPVRPTNELRAAHQDILDALQKDETAAAAIAKLEPAHKTVVVGAAAALQRAKKRGGDQTDAVASTKASVLQLRYLGTETVIENGKPVTRPKEYVVGDIIWSALAKVAL